MSSSGPTFVDLFCGAGGLSYGLEAGGWTCLLATDVWADAMRTYRHNMPHTTTFEGDVAALDAATLDRLLDGARPEWVVGGPPCQGFSTVGKRQRHDPRNRLFLEFKRIVQTLQPSGFVLENVLGLKDMRFVNAVQEAFREIGYEVTCSVLSAAEYGVPQLRRRVVFVGHREAGYFCGPVKTHSLADAVTVWDAIGDLPPVGPGETATAYGQRRPKTEYQRQMRAGSAALQGHTVSAHPARLVEAIACIPDGGNRRHIPDHLQPKSGFHNSYSRLASGAPAVAVTSNMGKPSGTRCIHPFQHRGLTAREGARLQSFPDVFHFLGGVTSQRLQVANAVPPLLAQAIAGGTADATRWAGPPEDSAGAA